MCVDGCVPVGIAIHTLQMVEDQGMHSDAYSDLAQHLLAHYPCFGPIDDGDYGHINYAAIGYAASKGHESCIRQLVQFGLDWHAELDEMMNGLGFGTDPRK